MPPNPMTTPSLRASNGLGSKVKRNEQFRSPVAERVHQGHELAVGYPALIQFAREFMERALDDGDSFVLAGHSPALSDAICRRIPRKE